MRNLESRNTVYHTMQVGSSRYRVIINSQMHGAVRQLLPPEMSPLV